MSLSKFEVFVTVIESGSLTRAGELLGMTQSAVSHVIASLEREYGFSILTRGRSGISLTSNGEHLLTYMREMLRKHEQMMQEVSAINGIEVGTVRIGTFTSVSTQWLPGILKQFQDQYPAIEIKLLEGYYDDIESWIVSGAVDMGFVSLPTSETLEAAMLHQDRMMVIVTDDHPVSLKESVPISQLQQETFIMPKTGCDNDIQRIFRKARFAPKVKYELGDDHAIIAMVQSGLGISILPEMILFRLPPNIRAVPLEGDHFRSLGVAVPSMAHLSPASRRFFDCVTTWVRENTSPQ